MLSRSEIDNEIELMVSRSRADFSARASHFGESDLHEIQLEARRKLETLLSVSPPADLEDLRVRWNEVVRDFHENDHWGHRALAKAPPRKPKKKGPADEMVPFLRTFLVPVFINKSILFFFGVQYSRYPGQGYGYGLVFMIVWTLSTFAYFCWKESKKPESQY